MNETVLEKVLDYYLQDNSLEDFLEEFNITPLEALTCLHESGMIDDMILQRMVPTDAHEGEYDV